MRAIFSLFQFSGNRGNSGKANDCNQGSRPTELSATVAEVEKGVFLLLYAYTA
jgi:hypothetical protein